MSTLETPEMRSGSLRGHRRATNEAEYSLTITASELFLKQCAFVFDKVIRYRLTAKALFKLQDLLLHIGHFNLKIVYTLLHYLDAHGHCDEFKFQSTNGADHAAATCDQPLETTRLRRSSCIRLLPAV